MIIYKKDDGAIRLSDSCKDEYEASNELILKVVKLIRNKYEEVS